MHNQNSFSSPILLEDHSLLKLYIIKFGNIIQLQVIGAYKLRYCSCY